MISPDDLKTEFSVVRNEFESGENQPQWILEERLTETAFLWHNYGKPTIGSTNALPSPSTNQIVGVSVTL